MNEANLDEVMEKRSDLYNSVKLNLANYLKIGGGAAGILAGAAGALGSLYFGREAAQNQDYYVAAAVLFATLGNLALANVGKELIYKGTEDFRTRRDVKVINWENSHFEEFRKNGYFERLAIENGFLVHQQE